MPYRVLLLALLLTGCGQKGPLYLPAKAPGPTNPAAEAGSELPEKESPATGNSAPLPSPAQY